MDAIKPRGMADDGQMQEIRTAQKERAKMAQARRRDAVFLCWLAFSAGAVLIGGIWLISYLMSACTCRAF